MRKQRETDLYYSPPKNTNIAWIYPWKNAPLDILISTFNKGLLDENKIIDTLAKFFPLKETIYLDSGRSAIMAALKGWNVGPDDEIILSTFNCQAVIDPIINLGATPVLVDTDQYGKIDVDQIEKYSSEKTKVIILTNIYGVLDNFEEIHKFALKRKIKIIDDLCQSLVTPKTHSKYFNKNNVAFVFSFGFEKHLSAIGGGALFCKDKKFIDMILRIYKFEIFSSYETWTAIFARIKYFFTLFVYSRLNFLVLPLSFLGIINKFDKKKSLNIKVEKIYPKTMNFIQLRILANKLQKLNKDTIENLAKYNFLKNELYENSNVKFIPGAVINPLYATIIAKGERYELTKYLSKNGIPSVWNYIPLHLFPIYSKYGKGKFLNSNKLWKNVISLPFRGSVSEKSLYKTVKTLGNFYNK